MQTMLGKQAIAFGLVLFFSFSALGGAALAGRNGPAAPTATLTVTTNPAPVNSYFQAQGCGYGANKVANIVVNDGNSMLFFAVGSDVSGCVSFSGFTGSAGTYVLSAYQNLQAKKQTLVASTTFSVR